MEEDRAWLKGLDAALWPPKDNFSPMLRQLEASMGKPPRPRPPEPKAELERDELNRIFKLVEEGPLVSVLFSYSAICGVGLRLFEHEQFPGSGPEKLLSFTEEHLPRLDDRSVYDHMRGIPKKERKHSAGTVRGDAWDLFTKYTHSEKNREWLTRYKIPMHFEKVYYDY